MKRILLVLLVATPSIAALAAEPGPAFGATLTVNSTANNDDANTADGVCDADLATPGDQCTLRAAIQQANQLVGTDTIVFNVPTGGPDCYPSTSICTIAPNTPFPLINSPVIIDGSTQPGYDPLNPTPMIELSGIFLGGTVDGLKITGGSSTVRGLIINDFGTVAGSDGLELTTFGGNVVEGNCLGTKYTCEAVDLGPGTGDEFGNQGNGVFVNGISNNTIGGTTPAKANVIAGNFENGIRMCTGVVGCSSGAATGNVVIGNFIGTNRAGSKDLGNTLEGVLIENAPGNIVGGTAAEQRNVISGNNSDGVEIKAAGATGNAVMGNYIGTNTAGNDDQRNSGAGVNVNGTANNTVGGTAPGARNLISGNFIGIQITGAAATNNFVLGNFIGTNFDASNALDPILRGQLGDGVIINSGAKNNVIGGTTASARNIISGNGSDGIEISSSTTSGNVVQGNYIGTDVSGTSNVFNGSAAIAAGNGIKINNSPANTIGGTTPGAGNLISGNRVAGIEVSGGTATANVIQGNFIGTDLAGSFSVGNGEDGVFINNAKNTMVGGTTPGARNLISGNGAIFLTDGVFIQGSSATGNLVQGNLIGTDITGTGAVGNSNGGVFINGAPNNTIGGTTGSARNIISGNGLIGVLINQLTATGNLVQGNYIGLDINGTAAIANGGDGVRIASAPGNTIGGTVGGARNVISGNLAVGVDILDPASTNNAVQGNYIGTDATGTAPVGNFNEGVFVNGGISNVIGGTTSAARNLISGNTIGVAITDGNAQSNVVQGNFIGTNAAGTGAIANTFDGVRLAGSASNNTVGGAGGASNIIAYNGGDGVFLDQTAGFGNKIDLNSIFSNGGLGIDIFPDGVTLNDAGDPDTGPNGLQNFPALSLADSTASGTTIAGTLNSTANTNFTVQLFYDTACDPSGYGEGRIFVGSITVPTNGSGDGGFNQIFPTVVASGWFVTATATDPGRNTSEFSACQQATGVPQPPLLQGDVDCSGGATPVSSIDALKILRYTAGLSVSQALGCPLIGTVLSQIFGDVDCGGIVNSIDALKVLRHAAGLPVQQIGPEPDSCTNIGLPLP